MSQDPKGTSLPPIDSPQGVPTGQFRRFLSRAETVTLIGMVLVVFSLFFTWQHIPLDVSKLPPGAMLIEKGGVYRTGMSQPWLAYTLTLCAALCSLSWLMTPTRQTRLPLNVLQVACGLACFMIALTRFALLPGVLLGLIGGALLTLGAVDRFTTPLQNAANP